MNAIRLFKEMCKVESTNKGNIFRLIGNEIMAHIHYSVFAVIIGMLCVWLIPVEFLGMGGCACHHHHGLEAMHKPVGHFLFHIVHYMHTFFASVTATLTAKRFSGNLFKSILVGIFVPPVFCTMSDILFPYWGGKIIGIEMSLHLCIFENVWPVLSLIAIGVSIGAFLSSRATSNLEIFKLAASSHFLHDFVSAAASLLYLIGFGCHNWTENLIYIFLLMLIAVVIPCMLSDLVLPMLICAPSVDNLKEETHDKCCVYKFYKKP